MPPTTRPGSVGRGALVAWLAGSDDRPIVSVVAPAGYGKTTLLSQWARRERPSFAWVSLDEGDNEPKVLLTYVAAALDRVEPVGAEVFDALASPASSVPGSVVPRLGSALASRALPVVLVLDDVHVLHNREGRAALSVLTEHVPVGSRLALVGREEPPVRTSRLRAQGRIVEIGAEDLAFSSEEASVLLRNAGVELDTADAAQLYDRTEGWPAGLYLAALYLREGGSVAGAAGAFGGGDWTVSGYVESELLSGIPRQQRQFLTPTAVLERMSGPLCDAVLERRDSAATLAKLARSNLLLVPLDRRRQWYRYHHLFRDMLLADLERHEPSVVPVLRQRAASWCLGHDPEAALEYSMAAGDVEMAARLVEQLAGFATRPRSPAVLTHYRQDARINAFLRWFRWLEDHGGVEEHPFIAVLGEVLCAMTGRPAEAERLAEMVDRWQYGGTHRLDDNLDKSAAPAALVRAMLCRHGVEQMRSDAEEAVRLFGPGNGVGRVASTLYLGMAHLLLGDLQAADMAFDDVISAAERADTPVSLAIALSERSLVSRARGEWEQAQAFAEWAGALKDQPGIKDTYCAPLVRAAQARAAWHRGEARAVRLELTSAQRTRHLLTYALPHLAVQARVELGGVYLAIGDAAGAATLLREVDDVLRRRPRLGTLVAEAEALRSRLSKRRGLGIVGASALTAAELRVLPMLCTHLSFPQIGGEMFISRHTVKSQAMSIYRKLGVGSRAEAVARARDLGLLDG
jgi:LuxR family transcriptional regulator, maltose regulon positive regulatory protein